MSFFLRKASDDPGAFGMLDSRRERILEGRFYRLAAILARRSREANAWSYSLLYGLHRHMFENIFPESAGKERQTEVMLGAFPVPAPGKIKDRLRYLVESARSLIEESASMSDGTARAALVFPKAALFHADSVVTQPFIDGNKRWARLLLNALLIDCGFKPGTIVYEEQRAEYMRGIEKAIAGDADQLATILLRGWLEEDERYRSGAY